SGTRKAGWFLYLCISVFLYFCISVSLYSLRSPIPQAEIQSDPNTWSQQIPAGFIFASFAQNHRQLIAPALVKKLTISSHSNIGWKRACCIAGPNSIHASGISKVPLSSSGWVPVHHQLQCTNVPQNAFSENFN
uniref:Uncharacterized protein n=1 Tax=Anas platyrhynchos platyrhynchos TaxID=8840 RepID=A0A493U1P6_ANAPP